MFPNILLFQPEAARALLQYRIQTLGGALDNARNLGYQVRGPEHSHHRDLPWEGPGHPAFSQTALWYR